MKERPPLSFPSICHLRSLAEFARWWSWPGTNVHTFHSLVFCGMGEVQRLAIARRILPDLRKFLGRQEDPLQGFSIVNLSRVFLEQESTVPGSLDHRQFKGTMERISICFVSLHEKTAVVGKTKK